MEDFSIMANNNPTDMDAYKKYMEEERRLNHETKYGTKKKRIEKNLKDWTLSINKQFRKCTFATADPKVQVHLKKLSKMNKMYNTMIISERSDVKIKNMYCILHSYILKGWVAPSQIRFTTLYEGVSNINGSFQSRPWKDHFFSPDSKLLVIRVGMLTDDLLHNKNLARFWMEVFDFCESTGATFLVLAEPSGQELTQPGKASQLPLLAGDTRLVSKMMKESIAIYFEGE